MIHYDLKCSNGHIFDEWFTNASSCDFNLKHKVLLCPICEDVIITKAPMAPNISKKDIPETISKPFEEVGENFAKEVRDIYHGYAEGRNISGTVTVGDITDLTKPVLKSS